MTATLEFATWATGFSGCDGGNLKGSTWLCGIEHGGREADATFEFTDVTRPGYFGDPSTWNGCDIDDFLKYQYNWRAVKLLSAIAGYTDISKYAEFFHDHHCFRQEGAYLKLNLYPIGFQSTAAKHWRPWLSEKTGLTSKDDYLAWCREHRFPVLKQWVREYLPRVIICTGYDHRAQFLQAFTDGETPTQEIVAGKTLLHVLTNGGKMRVVVTYFLGTRHGLKSNSELLATGRRIAELCQRLD